MEENANELRAAGKNDNTPRHYIANNAGLNPQEEATLKAIAADYWAKTQAILSAGNALAASGIPKGDQRYKDLANQRQQIALDHMSQIQTAFGPTRFSKLDRYVRSSVMFTTRPASARKH